MIATAKAHVAPRKRRWVTQGVLAMTFAALMAVATSVPANALMSTSDVQAQLIAAKVAAIPAGKTQAIVGDGDGAAPAQVSHDGYTVTSAEQVAARSNMRTANTFTNDPRGTIQWPFPVGVPISSGFGARSAPTEGASTYHQGVDFVPGAGTPIQIIADGVVRQVFPNNDNGCGVHAVIDHIIKGQLVSSVYCHMQVGSLRVAAGQQVKVGDIVGRVGNTGVSTGAHLHFEIRLNGTQAVDPIIWLKANAN
jgi:murein DD-endopeptidase MepM/ murein hydrolase activator NlpD